MPSLHSGSAHMFPSITMLPTNLTYSAKPSTPNETLFFYFVIGKMVKKRPRIAQIPVEVRHPHLSHSSVKNSIGGWQETQHNDVGWHEYTRLLMFVCLVCGKVAEPNNSTSASHSWGFNLCPLPT